MTCSNRKKANDCKDPCYWAYGLCRKKISNVTNPLSYTTTTTGSHRFRKVSKSRKV